MSDKKNIDHAPDHPKLDVVFKASDEEKRLITPKRKGFLPFDNNAFDRVFISVMLLVAIHLSDKLRGEFGPVGGFPVSSYRKFGELKDDIGKYRLDLGINLGVRYLLNTRIAVGIRYFQSLTDISNVSLFVDGVNGSSQIIEIREIGNNFQFNFFYTINKIDDSFK